LVIFASRREEAHAFLGVLQDWSALGLIGDFLYVDVDRQRAGLGSQCVSVSGGVSTDGVLHDVLARRRLSAAVRVVCVSRVSETFSSVGNVRGGAIQREVAESLPSTQLTWIHAISVSVPDAWPEVPEGDLAWVGAHNVILAPENSQSPRAGVAPITARERLTPVGLTHQAAALCSAAGLWATEPRTMFHGESGGGQLVALRTYTRHIAMEDVRARVLSNLVDLRHGYPIPKTHEGLALQRIDDEARAAGDMVDALFKAHPEIGPGRREVAERVVRVATPFLESLRRFLRFFGGVMRGAPRALLNELEHEVSQRIATAAQGLMYGGDRSGYVITVNGIRGLRDDGTIAPETEVDEEIDRLLAQVGGAEGATVGERQEYPAFWHDFVDGALTLLDGLARDEALPPPRIGVTVAVVSRPSAVAPDPDDSYPIDERVRSLLRFESIAPFDDDLARRIYRLLGDHAVAHPEQATSLRAAQTNLKERFDETGRSYVGGVGKRLASALDHVRDEVLSGANELRSAQAESSLSDEHAESQRSLGRTLLSVAGLHLLVALGVIWLAYVDVISWRAALPAVPAVGAVWLLLSTLIFAKRQHKVFQLLHEREHAATRLGMAKVNLRHALTDLRRLRSVYRQYLAWAQAMGTFVRSPLGRTELAEDRPVDLGEGFSLNHRFGVVVPDDHSVEVVIRQIQSELFRVGWLSDAWNGFLSDPPEFRDLHLVEADPELLFTDRPVSDKSVLAQWSNAVRLDDRTDATGEIGRQVDERLAAQRGVLFQNLTRTIRSTDAHGQTVDVSYDDFIAGLPEGDSATPAGERFSRRMYAEVTQSTEPWSVDQTMVNGRRERSRMIVVSQTSRTFRPQDLAFGARSSTPHTASTWPSEPIAPPQV
jgi:hypothetical protein